MDEYCPHCYQKIGGYQSSVSKGVVETLKRIYGVVEKKGLNIVHIEKEMVQEGLLTGNQAGNKTHMVRLGLLAHIEGEPGNYALTTKAVNFLNGEPIPRRVKVEKATAKGGSRTVSHSEEMCTIRDFKGGEYWIVPGFEIREGRIIQARMLEI